MFSYVTATKPNTHDTLAKCQHAPYFRDALVTPITNQTLTASDIQLAIFGYLPKWVTLLMGIRNKIVSKFGFDVGVSHMATDNTHLKMGDKVGFMHILSICDNEMICVAKDKHMDFYLSVQKNQTTATISTLVNQKTLLGRLYVNAILPFHYVIARAVINNAAKAKRI